MTIDVTRGSRSTSTNPEVSSPPHDPFAGLEQVRPARVSLLAFCWLVVIIAQMHAIGVRSNASAVQTPGMGAFIEIAYMGVVGMYAVVLIRAVVPDLLAARIPGLLFAFPVISMVSFLWSANRFYSLSRGVELAIIAFLAWATMLVLVNRGVMRYFLRQFTRGFLLVVGGLCIEGFIFGGIGAQVSGENAERFTWMGAHPNSAGWALAVAIVIAIWTPADVLGVPLVKRAPLLALLGFALYENHSRNALLTMVGGLAVGWLLTIVRDRHARFASAPFAVASVVVPALLFASALQNYFNRGQTSDEVWSGNGRSEVWALGIRLLRTPFDWVFGFGYGRSRTIFLAEIPWATSAHNSLMSLLINVGLIGTAAAIAVAVGAVIRLVMVSIDGGAVNGLLLALTVSCIIHGAASDSAAEPGAGFALIYLIAAIARAASNEYGDERVTLGSSPEVSPAAAQLAGSGSHRHPRL